MSFEVKPTERIFYELWQVDLEKQSAQPTSVIVDAHEGAEDDMLELCERLQKQYDPTKVELIVIKVVETRTRVTRE